MYILFFPAATLFSVKSTFLLKRVDFTEIPNLNFLTYEHVFAGMKVKDDDDDDGTGFNMPDNFDLPDRENRENRDNRETETIDDIETVDVEMSDFNDILEFFEKGMKINDFSSAATYLQYFPSNQRFY